MPGQGSDQSVYRIGLVAAVEPGPSVFTTKKGDLRHAGGNLHVSRGPRARHRARFTSPEPSVPEARFPIAQESKAALAKLQELITDRGTLTTNDDQEANQCFERLLSSEAPDITTLCPFYGWPGAGRRFKSAR